MHLVRTLAVSLAALLLAVAAHPQDWGAARTSSWLLGDRDRPRAGRLTVALLAARAEPGTIASLVDPDRLADFLRRLDAADVEPDDELEPMREDLFGRIAIADWLDGLRERGAVEIDVVERLADEVPGIPLVVVPRSRLNASEITDLAAYVASGGTVFLVRDDDDLARAIAPTAVFDAAADAAPRYGRVDGRVAIAVGVGPPSRVGNVAVPVRAATEQLLDVVLRESRLVVGLTGERPLSIAGARRAADAVVLDLDVPTHPDAERARVDARLVDVTAARGGAVWSGTFAVGAPVTIPCPASLDPVRHRVDVRWRARGVVLATSATIDALVGAVERHLLAGRKIDAGGTWSARVLCRDSKSGAPLAGHRLDARIVQDGRELAADVATTAADGVGELRFAIPATTPAGAAALELDGFGAPIALEVRRNTRHHVTVDRTLYRPTDRIHVRALVHASPTGQAAPAAPLSVELRKRGTSQPLATWSGTTSDQGIAATSFELVDREPGRYSVRSRVGGRGRWAIAEFRVEAFETPNFVVTVDPARARVRRDEIVPVTARVRYVDGTPVRGAKVTAVPTYGAAIEPGAETGATDADGSWRVDVSMNPDGDSRWGAVELTVVDADGRTESVVTEVLFGSTAAALEIELLDAPVMGEPARISVRAFRPADGRPWRDGNVEWSVRGESRPALQLDADGRGVVSLRPTHAKSELRFSILDGEVEVKRTLRAALLKGGPYPKPDRFVAREGETLRVGVDAHGGSQPVYLDVCRDGVVVRTLRVPTSSRTIDLELDRELTGVVELRSYAWDGAAVVGARQHVLVLRDDGLSVDLRPERAAWRPGETARVRVQVRDREATPTAATLGYWVVDTALLALSPWRPADEPWLDVPRGELRALAAADARERTLDSAWSVLGGPASIDSATEWSLVVDELAERRRAVRDAAARLARARLDAFQDAFVAAYSAVPIERLPRSLSLRQTVGWLVRHADLDSAVRIDPWGRELRIQSILGKVRSVGVDGIARTRDDVVATWDGYELRRRLPKRTRQFLTFVQSELLAGGRESDVLEASEGTAESAFDSNAWNSAIGLGGGAGGRFGGRAAQRPQRASGARTALAFEEQLQTARRDFRPTLTFVPERVVPAEGAVLELPLADSVTTWRMRAVASRRDGAIGVAETDVVARLPLGVEPWVVGQLTVGDAIDVPVLVRNGTDEAVDVAVAIRAVGADADAVDIVGESRTSVAIAANGSAACTFRIAARRPTARVELRIDANSAEHRDAVARSIRVHPHARPEERRQNGVARAGADWVTTWPIPADCTAPGSLSLEITPDALSQVVAGFDALVAEPHGCFEQTSSTLYPMVLAVRYLDAHGLLDDDPAGDGDVGAQRRRLAERARRYVRQGYERLLGFEVERSGGFELFGRAPAHTLLTAYGLLEFVDIGSVHRVQPALLTRVQEFLASRRAADGSFDGAGFGAVRGTRDRFRATAFVTWALGAAAAGSETTAPSLAWLDERVDGVDDPYDLALAALAFLAAADGDEQPWRARADRLVATLLDRGVRDDLGRSWAGQRSTWLGSRGVPASIETTALVANVLVAAGRRAEAREAVNWLLAHRTGGRFGTTFGTVLSLRALVGLELDVDRRSEAPTVVTVEWNGVVVAKHAFAAGAGQARRVVVEDRLLPSRAGRGDHRLVVRVDGPGEPRFAATATLFRGWAGDVIADGARVGLRVAGPDAPLGVRARGELAVELFNPSAYAATNVVAEIGLPPGCDVRVADVVDERLARVERAERHVVVYVDRLAVGETLRFAVPFAPRYGLAVRSAPSRAREYYQPDANSTAAPVDVVVR